MKAGKKEIVYKEIRDWEREGAARVQHMFIEAADPEYERCINIDSNNAKYALETAVFFKDVAQMAILYEKYDYADKYMNLAYPYSQIAIEKNIRRDVEDILQPMEARYTQYRTRYLLEWYKTGIEAAEYEDKILEYTVKLSDEMKGRKFKEEEFKEKANMNAIRDCTHIGAFELAKEQLAVYYTRKKNQELNEEVIYTPRIFYDYILEYLSDEENHRDMYEKLKAIFMTFFKELEKNNWTLRLAYEMDENRSEIYYIWYRYFEKVDRKELTAINVYQSLRYGLYFWRK